MYIDTMFPDELDSYIAKSANKDTGPVAVIPVGSVEQHGPHLLLGTDGFTAHALAAMTAEKAGAVLFPMIPFSWIGGLRPFAGTIDIRPLNAAEYMEQIGLNIARWGFKKLVIINTHGGGRETVYTVARRLFKKTGLQVITMYPSNLYDSWPELEKIWADHGVTFDWGISEPSSLVSSLRYLNQDATADKVIQNLEDALAEYGENFQVPSSPGLHEAFRLGEVGHDYTHECMHARPNKGMYPEIARKVQHFMAEKLAWGVENG